MSLCFLIRFILYIGIAVCTTCTTCTTWVCLNCMWNGQGTGSRLPGGCEALWRGSDPARPCHPGIGGVPWHAMAIGRQELNKAFWRTSARPPKPVRSRSLEAQQRSNTETPAKQPMISVDSAIAEKSWSNVEICRIQMKYTVYMYIYIYIYVYMPFSVTYFELKQAVCFATCRSKAPAWRASIESQRADAPSLHALAPQSPRMSWTKWHVKSCEIELGVKQLEWIVSA